MFSYINGLGVFFLVCIGFVVYSRQKLKRQCALFANHATRRNGITNTSFATAHLEFPFQNYTIRVESYVPVVPHIDGKSTSIPTTKFEVEFLRHDGFDCTIDSEKSAMDIIKEFFGKKDIQVSDEAFDAEFVLKGSDEEGMRQIVSENLRHKLLELKKFKPIIHFRKGKFIFRVPRNFKREEDLGLFIETGLVFVENANRFFN